eukprot:Partr_v1_DN25439_c0_g1_i3_m53770 putative cleavage stimulation factor, 3' pre-RNA, subunit 1, 50kDa
MTVQAVDRDQLLRMIIHQLQYLDLGAAAALVSEASGAKYSQMPSNQLATYVALGQAYERENPEALSSMDLDMTGFQQDSPEEQADNSDDYIGPCLEFPSADTKVAIAEKIEFETMFLTAHKLPVTCSAFNLDGRYVATGSGDASLKVLDVTKLKAYRGGDDKPLIRTFYDHTLPVNDVAFHPNSRVLASCSDDCTIKLYDLQRVSVKRGFRFLQDVVPIKSISFHPSGDYIAAATADNIVRLYDVTKLKCFTGTTGASNHEMSINHIRYHSDGKMYVTAGEDGTVKVWDAVSSQCIQTIDNAHGGEEVCSASISLNGKYIFSSGMDGVPRLWDLSSGVCLMKYNGASTRYQSSKASMTWNEEYVLAGNDRDRNSTVTMWCSRTGTLLQNISGHSSFVNNVVASPSEDFFVSCSNDSRARFWLKQETE